MLWPWQAGNQRGVWDGQVCMLTHSTSDSFGSVRAQRCRFFLLLQNFCSHASDWNHLAICDLLNATALGLLDTGVATVQTVPDGHKVMSRAQPAQTLRLHWSCIICMQQKPHMKLLGGLLLPKPREHALPAAADQQLHSIPYASGYVYVICWQRFRVAQCTSYRSSASGQPLLLALLQKRASPRVPTPADHC